MLSRIAACLVVCCGLLGCSSESSIRKSQQWSDAERSRNITLMPPQAIVNNVDIGGKNNRLYDYEYNIESILAEQAVIALERLNYRTKYLHRRDIHEAKLEQLLSQMHNRRDELREQLYNQILWPEKKAFAIDLSMGPAAVEFGEKSSADLIMFIDYSRFIKDPSARALNLASSLVFSYFLGHSSGDADADVAVITAMIVDARTGQILWSNIVRDARSMFSSSTDKTKENKHASALMKKLFAPLQLKKR